MCISILHTPGDDPLGYETAAERWSPVQSIEKILLSVVSMMAEPNDESGANVDACVSGSLRGYVLTDMTCGVLQKMWRDDRSQFNEIAQRLVRKSLAL